MNSKKTIQQKDNQQNIQSNRSILPYEDKVIINLADDDEEDEDHNELDDWNFQQIIQNQQLNLSQNQEKDQKSNLGQQNNLQDPFSNQNGLKINMSMLENTPSNSIMQQKREDLIQSFANRQRTEEKKKETETNLSQLTNKANNQQHSNADLDDDDDGNASSSEESSSHLQQRNAQQPPQQDGQFQKIFKDIVIWILIITFVSILILIFYSFLKIIIDQTREISKPHYEIINYNKTNTGISVLAQCKRCSLYYVDQNNPIADTIQVDIKYMKNNQFSINFATSNFTEWSLPEQKPFPYFSFEGLDEKKISKRDYFVMIKEKPLEICIYRISTSEKILMISSIDLIYSYLYKDYKVQLPTNKIYGIGENNSNFTIRDGVYTLWNKRNSQAQGNGQIGSNSNSYHPVFLVKENSNAFHIIYIRSSSPIDILKDSHTLEIKMATGIIHLIIFLGDEKPQKAVEDFHSFLGGYTIPPLWSIGAHYKINNMKNTQQISDIQAVFGNNKMQLDVLWFDSSIYRDNKSFFFNKETFNLTQFKNLTSNLQIIPEIQPGIKIDQDSIAYNEGIQRNIFLKKNEKEEIVFGKNSYKQSTHYPDYFHPQIQDYTNDLFGYLYQDITNRGCFLVDNEITDYTSMSNPASLLNNSQNNNKHSLPHKIKSNQQGLPGNTNITTFNLPYIPGNRSLDDSTLNIRYLHSQNIMEIHAHNTFSIMQSYSAYQYQHKLAGSPFPFIVSKSTSPGFGQYGALLVEQPGCDWKSLQLSLSNMLNYNILGIPQVGFIICPKKDTFQNIDEELFGRWMQLSVFYSFYIIESDGSRVSEFLTNPRFLKYYEKSFSLRLILSKYIYTLFFLFQGTGSLIKPLFFDFPEDELLYSQEKYINEQFLVGDALMVTPIFEPNKSIIYPYFPQDSWFDFYSGEQIKKESQQSSVEEVKNSIDNQIPIFMRGGTIVPLQTGYDSLKNISEQTTDYDLLIAFKILEDGTMYAKGNILGKTVFSDSSIYESCIKENCLIKVQIYSQTVVVRPPKKSNYKIQIVFDTIIPFIQVDTIKIRTLILMLEQRRVVYQANYTVSGKTEFNFSVTP